MQAAQSSQPLQAWQLRLSAAEEYWRRSSSSSCLNSLGFMEDKWLLRITARCTRDGPSGYHIVRAPATPTAAPPSTFKNNFRARAFYQEMDPRWLQIAFLSSFLACGLWLGVVPAWQPPLCLAAALVAQEV